MSSHPLLQAHHYFDFTAHPFEHEELFRQGGVQTVVDVLDLIEPYCREWLDQVPENAASAEGIIQTDAWKDTACEGRFSIMCEAGAVFSPDRIISGDSDTCVYIAENATVRGGTFDISQGSVFIGPGAALSGSWICGPVIIGEGSSVLPGAYIRENVILGRRVIVRGEIKNTVIMDDSEFAHQSYLGDSLCGYKTHFGNQATAANLNIFGHTKSTHITIDGHKTDLARRKVGIIMGDYCQLGCNAVSDPGTFLLPRTIVYSLTRVNSGVYGPDELIKNKPMEHGIIERVPLVRKS
jgi:hypothetical protein